METIKIAVHIANHATFADLDCHVFINVPAIPPIGSQLYLTTEQQEVLEKNADKSMYSEYLYGEQKEYISFDDAVYVKSVLFDCNDELYHIELSSSLEKE